MVDYGAVDLYWGRRGRMWRCRSLLVNVEWESRAIFLTIYDDLSLGYMYNVKPVRRTYSRVRVDLWRHQYGGYITIYELFVFPSKSIENIALLPFLAKKCMKCI